jgi:tetratricopeptide (TPR) repeat protein
MPVSRSRKRASGKRSVVVGSNPGIVATGNNPTITINQRKQSTRRLKRIIYGEIPRRPPAFQPRDDLHNKLLNAGPLAIISTLTGTRGIGKSQLAAAYARECIDDGWLLVAWIGAERSDQILGGLDQLSMVMGLHDDTDDSVSAANKIRRWLETTASKRCLIIFDNANDPDSLTDWLPSTGNARIIITSNQRSFESLGTLIDVEAFSADEALTYLRERTGLHDEAGALALSEEVGHLPLALAQASAVVKAQNLSYSDFLDRLREVTIDKYLTRKSGDAYPRGAVETVLLSVGQLWRRNKISRRLSLLLSVLSPEGIPRELLYSHLMGGGVIGWILRTGNKVSRAKIDEALGQLVEASLATISVDGQTVIMHRFTQRVIREYANNSGIYPLVLRQVSQLIGEQFQLSRSNWEQGIETEALIQQTSALWDNVAIESAADVHNISRRAGYFGKLAGRRYAKELIKLRILSVAELNRTGNAARAIELGTSVMRECRTLFGPDYRETLLICTQLADAYKGAGQADEAIDLFERTLADHERILGTDHPHTLTSRDNLAVAYHEARRVDEAIALNERSLADYERILGPEHPDTLLSRGNLAAVYLRAERVDEAIALYQRTLADQERILSPDLPHTLNLFHPDLGAGSCMP